MTGDIEGVTGDRWSATSTDGTQIALVSAGAGPPLLLVHGGMTSSARWAPLWPWLTARFTVTAMDRRGRGRSGDAPGYALEREVDDVATVAERLAERHGTAEVDAFGHSIGAVFVLAAAARGRFLSRLALYEPPGPETVTAEWLDRVTTLVDAGEPGPAMASFLTEVVGLSWAEVRELRDTPAAAGALDAVAATMPREGRALTTVDLTALAARVPQPVLLLLGAESPAWAGTIIGRLAAALPYPTLVLLHGVGHEGVDTAAPRVAAELSAFFGGRRG